MWAKEISVESGSKDVLGILHHMNEGIPVTTERLKSRERL